MSLFGPARPSGLRPAHADLLSCLAALLIGLSFCLIDRTRTFPGWWALLPTFGAALAIAAGPHALLNRWLLSSRPMVWIGLISYPLYLWHWPLLAFARLLYGGTPPFEVRGALVLVSVVLAALTYWTIERPMRFGRGGRIVPAGLLAAMACAMAGSLFSLQAERREGLPRAFARANPLDSSGYAGGDMGWSRNGCGLAASPERGLFGLCASDSRQPPTLALLGDSKAAALYPGLVRTSHPQARWMAIGGNGAGGAMVPLISDREVHRPLQRLATAAVRQVANDPAIQTVAIVAATRSLFQLNNDHSIDDLPTSKSYDAALEGLGNFVAPLTAAGKRVVLMVDNPSLPDPTDCLPRITSIPVLNHLPGARPHPACEVAIARHLELSAPYRQLLLAVQRRAPDKIDIFDTLPYLCDTHSGVYTQEKGGRILYSYTDHVSDHASGLVGAAINRQVAPSRHERPSAGMHADAQRASAQVRDFIAGVKTR